MKRPNIRLIRRVKQDFRRNAQRWNCNRRAHGNPHRINRSYRLMGTTRAVFKRVDEAWQLKHPWRPCWEVAEDEY